MPTMTTVLIHLPVEMKRQLDALRSKGFTISGYIRHLLEKELNSPNKKGV